MNSEPPFHLLNFDVLMFNHGGDVLYSPLSLLPISTTEDITGSVIKFCPGMHGDVGSGNQYIACKSFRCEFIEMGMEDFHGSI